MTRLDGLSERMMKASASRSDLPSPESWIFRGRTIDDAGAPIAGAGVILAAASDATTQDALDRPHATTGQDGRFELRRTFARDVSKREPPEQRLLVAAPGRACAEWTVYRGWSRARRQQGANFGDIVLVPSVRIEGRVTREDGLPLAGARVEATDPLVSELGSSLHSDFTFRCVATTDEEGAFVLPCVARPGAALVVRAPGYYRVDLPFVAPEDSVVVEMRRGGTVAGRVLDAAGTGARAHVWIVYEANREHGRSSSTSADGAFRLDLEYPHRYRVRASTSGVTCESPILSAPELHLEIAPRQLSTQEPAITVRAVDADTGSTIALVQASVVWSDRTWLGTDAPHLQPRALHDLVPAAEIRLRGPSESEPERGVVAVSAPGYARALLDVVWDPRHPPVVEAKLARACAASGIVVDESTGQPVAGAIVVSGAQPRVISNEEREREDDPPHVTDAAGRFRIDDLPAGKHTLWARFPFRPISAPVRVTLERGVERAGVELVIPRGAMFHGTLAGAPIGPGWRVCLARAGVGMMWLHLDSLRTGLRECAVAADGSFAIAGVPRGDYRLSLRVPEDHGRGGMLELVIASVSIEGTDVQRDFDVSAIQPGVAIGRVRSEGAPFSIQRLVIEAHRRVESETEFSPWWGNHVRALVAADGSYRLDVRPGAHELRIVDLATNAVLLDDRDEVVVGVRETVRKDLALQLATVHVHLRPEDERLGFAASHLQIHSQHWPDSPRDLHPDSGGSVPLGIGARDVTLYLPPVPTRLRVYSNLSHVRSGSSAARGLQDALAVHDLTPVLGTLNLVDMEVKPPGDG